MLPNVAGAIAYGSRHASITVNHRCRGGCYSQSKSSCAISTFTVLAIESQAGFPFSAPPHSSVGCFPPRMDGPHLVGRDLSRLTLYIQIVKLIYRWTLSGTLRKTNGSDRNDSYRLGKSPPRFKPANISTSSTIHPALINITSF